jgi:hypothetical protein
MKAEGKTYRNTFALRNKKQNEKEKHKTFSRLMIDHKREDTKTQKAINRDS